MICLLLFLNFLKIGAFTFGGGYAMIPMMRETVLKYNWLTDAEMINFIAISESTPGPFAVNMATFIGTQLAGIPGAFLATLGVVLPSFLIILVVAKFYLAFKENRYVEGCMQGLRPTVVALIASAIISVGVTVFFPNGITFDVFGSFEFYSCLFISLFSFVLLKKKVTPIAVIVISAVLGIVSGYTFGL